MVEVVRGLFYLLWPDARRGRGLQKSSALPSDAMPSQESATRKIKFLHGCSRAWHVYGLFSMGKPLFGGGCKSFPGQHFSCYTFKDEEVGIKLTEVVKYLLVGQIKQKLS